MKTKKCIKCGFVGLSDLFSKGKSLCKKCKAEYNAEYYKNNKDKRAERDAEYYKNNKDRIAEHKAEHYKKNKDKVAEYHAEYRKKNKDRIAEHKAEYCKNNKDKIADTYIKRLLTKSSTLTSNDIPLKLIELKRTQVKISRELEKHR